MYTHFQGNGFATGAGFGTWTAGGLVIFIHSKSPVCLTSVKYMQNV